MADLAPTVDLLHGAAMPRLGLGTWPLDDDEAARVVEQALGLGYRLVDTAENYRNEVGVGRGLRASGVPRDQVFLTTKFNREWHSVEGAAKAFEASAHRLGVDYLDLLLIHWPNPDQDRYVEAWQGLAALLEAGKVRAIGTSNFKPPQLERIITETGVVPDVNQIQLSPHATRASSRDYANAHGIVVESWSPLGKGGDLLREGPVTAAAERLGKTPGQVVLRWHIQHGLVAIPKTKTDSRLEENLAVFDFSLSEDEMDALDALDQGESTVTDSDRFGH